MRMFDRLLGALPWLLAALFAAGAVHIVSILAMPALAPDDAYARLARIVPRDRVVLLPRALPAHQVAPFPDPALVQSVCLFDTGRGPVRIRADAGASGFTGLSLHSRDGRIFYAMTDRSALDGKFDALVLDQAALDRLEAAEGDDAPQELRIVTPTDTGFVLLEALAVHPSEREENEARVAAMSCRNEPPR